MTLQEAKAILKTIPKTTEEVRLFKEALHIVGFLWATDIPNVEPESV